MKNFKTIATFSFPSEYAVFKLLLDQEEIRYFFLYETMIGILPFHSNVLGGIQLQVHEDDLEAAHKIKRLLDKPPSLEIV